MVATKNKEEKIQLFTCTRFQVLKHGRWLVATILDSSDREYAAIQTVLHCSTKFCWMF